MASVLAVAAVPRETAREAVYVSVIRPCGLAILPAAPAAVVPVPGRNAKKYSTRTWTRYVLSGNSSKGCPRTIFLVWLLTGHPLQPELEFKV